MKIVNYINAVVFNDSYAALKLASEDSKYIFFARKIISAKNTNEYCRLIMSPENNIDFLYAKSKIIQYNSFLDMLDSFEAASCKDSFHSANIHNLGKSIARVY